LITAVMARMGKFDYYRIYQLETGEIQVRGASPYLDEQCPFFLLVDEKFGTLYEAECRMLILRDAFEKDQTFRLRTIHNKRGTKW